jgi:allantoate deiminase
MIYPRTVPAAMLFLRTPGGLSHHPAESVSAPDVQAALETALQFVEHLDPAPFAGEPTS